MGKGWALSAIKGWSQQGLTARLLDVALAIHQNHVAASRADLSVAAPARAPETFPFVAAPGPIYTFVGSARSLASWSSSLSGGTRGPDGEDGTAGEATAGLAMSPFASISFTSIRRSARFTMPCASPRCSSNMGSLQSPGPALPSATSLRCSLSISASSSGGMPTVRNKEAIPALKTRSSQRWSGAWSEPRTTSCRVEMPQTWSAQVSRTSACSFPTKPKKTSTVGAVSFSRTASADSPSRSFLPSMDTSRSPALMPTLAAWPPSRIPATTTWRRPPPRRTMSSLGDSPSW
mmetsp:Transcript_84096/g.238238  ORF Transcript_84096/g.238238 Transcript_84096/m.238238 type:complete len:291 (+) Transcript_84096:102-974(+)